MLPVPDESDAQRAIHNGMKYDLASLEQSHHLYVSKCGGCHTLYLPVRYKADKWNHVLDEMAVKAKLKPGEKQMILDYLVLMSEKQIEKK